MIPPIPYWAEKDDVLTCSSLTFSNVAGFAFWLCERVVDAPSAMILLYGRFPLTATSWPGFDEPWDPLGVPVAPGSRIVKFSQSWVTCGNSAIDFDSRVVLCSLVSVCIRATSADTVTDCVDAPTFSCALTGVKPTFTVTGPRTNFSKPSFLNVTVYLPGTIESVSYRPASLVV